MICNLLRGTMPLLLGVVVTAQTFNIDISVSPSTTPPTSFGAFPPQTGTWNGVAVVAATQQLSTTSGILDNTDAIVWPVPGAATQGGIPAPYTALYEDYATSGPGSFTIEFDELEIGKYLAVVYSWKSGASTFFRMENDINVIDSDGIVNCGAIFPSAGYVAGVSMTVLPFEIYLGLSGKLHVITDTMSALNGVQLVRYVGEFGCQQGTNSLGQTPQPICLGTFGSWGGMPGISVSADDLRVQLGLLPDSSLPPIGSILCFVSNDNAANVPYACPFIGTRCIGLNSLVRVVDPFALPGSGGAGMTTLNGTYELAISFLDPALQGLNLTPGNMLHFQFVYRDLDNANSCGGGAIARWTNSISVLLVP